MKKKAIRGRPAPQTRQAVGTAEAAAIMGVHWSTPCRMVAKGILTCHECPSRTPGAGLRRVSIFDGSECEDNFLDYQEKLAARGGMSDRRPRANLDARDDVLRHLAKVKQPIAFNDACGSAEASEILKVHPSFLTRMVASGRIIGRSPWNPRGEGDETRNWIFSRASCRRELAGTLKLVAAGRKLGRPRDIS